ncbi:MAG: imidazole glycerol phosphate synthase subunit HisH [Clostridia bacterium]|nr:imidazole glycerol phosphate synthase subunit HisH [Clostridia bacterium]
MIAIVDYGVGNLYSLQCSLKRVGAEAVVTADEKTLSNASKILLPGVGAFADAVAKLKEKGLDELLKEQAKTGKYIMGICLGMQMLFDESHEYGVHQGLGLIKGKVVPMRGLIDERLKVPHIGWNGLRFPRPHFLFKDVKEGDCAYFVHSYFATDCDESVIAATEYDKLLTAAVAKENILGCQFHPEKSGEVGLKILKAFCEV